MGAKLAKPVTASILRGIPLIFAVFLMTVPSARAALIFDNGTYNPANFGANFSEGNLRLADQFTVAAADVIRSTQFWGAHWDTGVIPATEDFTVIVYGDDGGLPDAGNVIGISGLSLVSRIDTGFNHNNSTLADILEYTGDLVSPISLPSAGDYWFSVFLVEVPGTQFAWQEVGIDNDSFKALSGNAGASWGGFFFGGPLAYNISNTFAGITAVPEPSSFALFGAGLAGLGALAWRQRKSLRKAGASR